jgi:hypothetical protein
MRTSRPQVLQLEDVVLPAGRYGPEGTSNFFLNTATGAMKVRPDAWPIVNEGREVICDDIDPL